MEELPIPRHVLNQIRSLSDANLLKLITEISQYSWSKAEPLLRLMIEERQKLMQPRPPEVPPQQRREP